MSTWLWDIQLVTLSLADTNYMAKTVSISKFVKTYRSTIKDGDGDCILRSNYLVKHMVMNKTLEVLHTIH